ncbi:hypothetical protein L1987_23194 [Smallanthus sonchifolius]|uniref:Uncharacterized protein n=1 Tax=Smallanthus sonchifolius TaxID=185202 RepID=A0ACB9IGZ5_9ASTR|nr:hypothetical protein L1987_23194 [Smallanthus sonchifolius]
MNNWLDHIMLNILMMMVAGKRYFGVGGGGDIEALRFQKAIFEFFRLSGVFVVSDAIPFLWWLDLHGYEKQMKKTAQDLDLVLGGWVDEHRQKRKLDLEQNKEDVKDFIDVMLSLEDEEQLPNIELDSDTIIKATCLAGIRLIVNVWKLQRDERVWSDASKFQPERFIGSDHEHVDLRGHQFVLVPFGLGRRSCPGITFALLEIHLTLARLVHSFDLGRPGGLPVDMTEGPGTTNPKKKPLDVILTPRPPSRIYGC